MLIYLRENSDNDQGLKEEELELKMRKQRLLEAQQKAQIDQQKDFKITVWERVWDNNNNKRSKWWY